MSPSIVWLTIAILAGFVGAEAVSKVSSARHPALVSGTNAIHGVILLGAILVTGSTGSGFGLAVGLLAIVLAAVNLVGGFVLTDRTVQTPGPGQPAPPSAGSTPTSPAPDGGDA